MEHFKFRGFFYKEIFLVKISIPCTSLLRLLIFPAMNNELCLLGAIIIIIKRKIFTLPSASCLQLSRDDLIISNGNSQLMKICSK